MFGGFFSTIMNSICFAFQELLSSRSDASFNDANEKVLSIREKLSRKLEERPDQYHRMKMKTRKKPNTSTYFDISRRHRSGWSDHRYTAFNYIEYKCVCILDIILDPLILLSLECIEFQHWKEACKV